ncbi:hypothetical protein Sste5346_000604 [Sporothrix stenoceras]|uniref:GRF-type domain-containing protein n=1 Tax=Sporothrix stenoceras TaxID=5173 RepID=A0ABR3ZVW5_9PEZI
MPRGGRRSGGRRSQPTTPRTMRTSNPATPSSGRGSDGLFANGQWFCDCKPRRPAVLRETRKPGANKGRWFYTCPQERRRQCTFFLWEDYAGVSGGGGGGAATAGPASAPRPTYRTSIGQRTTPPAERQDGPPMTLAGQRSLPPPAPPQTARQRQRIFTTPMASEFPGNMAYGGFENQGGEEEEEEEDDKDDFEPPPTPTPARTRRTSGRAAAGASLDATQAPPPTVETPSHPITKYFGVVKKSGDAGEGGSNGKNGVATSKAQRAIAAGRNASDYSDSEFDSDMERALVALADHSERKTRRRSDAAPKETVVKVKQEEDIDDGSSIAMDIEEAADRRRRIIVPVREEEEQQQHDEPETPTRRRLGRRLLVASDEYAAKEAAAVATIAGSATTTPTEAPTSGTYSFASLFGGSRNGEPLQPPPNFSFTSSVPSSQAATQAAPSQALSQASVDTAAMTTPSSSFRSEAGSNTGSGQKRRQVVDPWYGMPAQDDGNDESDDNDPFTTPSKRVRFREEVNSVGPSQEAATASWPTPTAGRPTVAAKEESSEPTTAVARQHWADDEGMHVDREDEPSASQELSSSQLTSSQSASQQPKDHNVTLAVLQLLAGQPIAPRVRQQVRALLNGAFAED